MSSESQDVLLGIFQLRHISKIKKCDENDEKYARERGRFSLKNGGTYLLEVKKIAKKRYADDDKRASVCEVLMNLYALYLWYLADFYKHQKGSKIFARGYGPRTRGGGGLK